MTEILNMKKITQTLKRYKKTLFCLCVTAYGFFFPFSTFDIDPWQGFECLNFSSCMLNDVCNCFCVKNGTMSD